MNNPSASKVSQPLTDADTDPGIIAIGLLTLEQKFEALDRLYNEEVASLSRELARLKEEYIRLYHSKPMRPRREKASRAPLSHAPLSRATLEA